MVGRNAKAAYIKEMEHKRYKQQAALVKQAMQIASFDGWNQAVLVKAAVAAGMPAMEAERLFPGGVEELLTWYSHDIDRQLHAKAAEAELATMRVHERIIWLVKTRFELMEPDKEAVRRAVALSLLPWHSRCSLTGVWRICDEIWYLAGDRSTDFNYYTKRGLLAKVYIATAFYWLNDDSPDHEASWAFLERRIAEVLKIGKTLGQSSKRTAELVEGLTDQFINRRRYRAKRRR